VARVDRIVEDSASYAKQSSADLSPTDRRPPAPAYRSSLIEVEDLSAPIIQQEIFGPVATFEVFDDEKDGGISAAVDTRSRRSPPDVAVRRFRGSRTRCGKVGFRFGWGRSGRRVKPPKDTSADT
jgi:hypothetical protein